jgi:uncharacterized protein with PQ loop repeat
MKGMHGGPVHHHQRIRKLAGDPAQPYLAAWDRVVWVVAFLGPLFTIPQIMEVWVFRETAGVSVLSWTAYTVFSGVWLVYAMFHRDRILLTNYIIWFAANGLVALGAALF